MTNAGFDNIFWPWLALGTVVRPSRLLPKAQKTPNYDSTCSRYYLGGVWEPYRSAYLRNYQANLNYVAGDTWGETQDVRMFLGDQNNPTGRLALRNQVMQPMHTRLMGAADNVSIQAQAQAQTQYAVTRKEADMNKMLLYSQAAQQGPMMAGAYQGMGVDPDEEKTQDVHDQNYQDQYVVAVNSMLTMMGIHQKLDKKKRQAASNLSLSGLIGFHLYPNGGHIECNLCRPEEVGWDTSSTRSDLSDGEFCYTARLMDVSAIAEQYQPAKNKIEALDRWANMTGTNYAKTAYGWPQRKPRVFTTYFKDINYIERGFVLKDGEPHFCTINKADPKSRDGKPEYTDSDLIEPPEDSFTITWTDSEIRNRKQTRAIEVLRYCAMVPWEYLPGQFTEGKPFAQREQLSPDKLSVVGSTGDLILESGEYPLQEADPDQVYSVEFPIKFATWSYLSGNVIAPLSAARDPQRVMNMVLSDLMWRMEKAPGSSIVYDSDAAAGGGMREADFLRGLKNSDPVRMKGALTGGVQNALTVKDGSLGASFYQQWQILDNLYQMAQSSTGIYDQNFGAPSDPRQLVGNKQLQLQQAGVMQQPFYAALSDAYQQVHQFNAQAGKLFYSARPWALSQMVGDKGAQALFASGDMTAEQFRVEIVLAIDSEERKKEADMMILGQGGYMDRGLLDQASAAKLLMNSYPEDVAEGARAYTKQAQQAAQMQAQEQQQQQQQMAAAVQQQNQQAQQDQLHQEQVKASLEAEKIQTKRDAPFASAKAKWMEPPEENIDVGVSR